MRNAKQRNDLKACFIVLFTGQDEPDTIGPEGVEKLCKDLGVDPEDVRDFVIVNNIIIIVKLFELWHIECYVYPLGHRPTILAKSLGTLAQKHRKFPHSPSTPHAMLI